MAARTKVRRPRGKGTKDNSIRSKLFEFKREQILEVAARLFYDRGYKSTTLDLIAKQLGVTKPFIYYHFKSKQDILLQLLERTLTKTHAIFDGIDVEQGRPSDVLRALIVRYVEDVIDIRMNMAMFWREQRELPAKNKAHMHEMKHLFDAQFTRVLERGIEAGEFTMADPAFTNLCISGMINWIYTWYRPEGRLSAQEIAAGVADLTLKMVSTA